MLSKDRARLHKLILHEYIRMLATHQDPIDCTQLKAIELATLC